MSQGQANPYPLRVPYDLMEKFKVVAAADDRSVNAQINQLIKRAVADYEAENGTITVED